MNDIFDSQVIDTRPIKKNSNGEYRWFVGRGVALGASKVQKVSQKNTFKRTDNNSDILAMAERNDPTTGLPNFKGFENQVSFLLKHRKKYAGSNFGIVIISLLNTNGCISRLDDKSRRIALKDVVNRILNCMRESDYLARTQWNEFSLILQDVESNKEVMAVQNRIQSMLCSPYRLDEMEIILDFKVGGVIRNIR